jgi:hypothetical protein
MELAKRSALMYVQVAVMELTIRQAQRDLSPPPRWRHAGSPNAQAQRYAEMMA